MDATKRSRYVWMFTGALLCLSMVALLLKMRDGNKAFAQTAANPTHRAAAAPPMLEPEPEPMPPPPLAPVSEAPPLALPAPGDATPPVPPALPVPEGEPLPTIKPVNFDPPALPGAELPAPVVPPPAVVPPPPAEEMPASDKKSEVPAPMPPRVGSDASPILIPGSTPAPPPPPPVVPPVAPPPVTPPAVPPAPPEVAPQPPQIQPVPYMEQPAPPLTRINNTEASTNELLQPLPMLRSKPTPKPKAVLPLTGTAVTVLEGRSLKLPATVLEQLGDCDTVLVSPGSSRCLWITNQAHLDRLGEKLEKSPAREEDIQAFKRLYFAQIVKLPVRSGRFTLTDRLSEFAGLQANGEVVLVGIDDHFELWDASTWRKFAATRKMADE